MSNIYSTAAATHQTFAAVEQEPITRLPVQPVLASTRFEYHTPNQYADTQATAARPAPDESSVLALLNSIREENRAFQQAITKRIVKVEDDITELLHRTNVIVHRDARNVPISLPVTTLDHYQNLISFLDDADNFNNLARCLSVHGGSTPSDITNRILSRLISNVCAESLSLTGKGKNFKSAVKDTPVQKLIYVAVRMNKGGESTTDHQIDRFIQKWLKGATDREGGRERRRRIKVPEAICNEGAVPSGPSNGGD
ncbi:unnamed protein product [Orchesella dallaii]|uniref:DUF4806 domain-containing protein n=1 Tax=Orchesella dallaii TaxID=48710 RepID=A0ABP1PUZ7_9HEXA